VKTLSAYLGIAVLYAFSLLPIWVLHRFSDVACFFIYQVWGYRKKVVRENLKIAFPEKSEKERQAIERQFFRNFCDLIFETVKTFTISPEKLRSRLAYVTPDVSRELWARQANVMGVSGHLANWEWQGLSLAMDFEHTCFIIYKPLSNATLNRLILRSRERFGAKLISIKKLREIFQMNHGRPFLTGLLSDQAPHDYSKAFEVEFFGRPTWITPGAGVLTVQRGMTPIWGWMKRVGRSRYEWGAEILDVRAPSQGGPSADAAQIDRIAKAHGLNQAQAADALALTRLFTQKLEAHIRENPADWLWSHRRWKER